MANALAGALQKGDVVFLRGDLGTGKTTFSQHLIPVLVGAPTVVQSPTFSLVNVYEGGKIAVWHYDFYRMTHPDELWELGVEEGLQQGVSLMEWPERLGTGMIHPTYIATFTLGPMGHTLEIQPSQALTKG